MRSSSRLLACATLVLIALGVFVGCSDRGVLQPVPGGGGGGIGPVPTVAPDTLDFGSVTLGDSAVRVVNIGNAGDSAFAGLASQPLAPFHIRSGGGAFTVAPGASHAVEVVFRPVLVGAASGALTLGSSLPTVVLKGVATTAPVGIGEVSTSTLDFGHVAFGSSSTLSLKLYNRGDAPLSAFSAVDNPVFTLTAGSGSLTVPAHDSVTISVRFSPSSVGSHTGNLALGAGNPQVSLSGIGDATVSFATQVLPMIQNSCVGCHGYGSHSAIVNVSSSSYAPAKLIEPGNTTNSVIYQKVIGSGTYGGAMPPSAGQRWNTTQKNLLRDWILQGALNN